MDFTAQKPHSHKKYVCSRKHFHVAPHCTSIFSSLQSKTNVDSTPKKKSNVLKKKSSEILLIPASLKSCHCD